jgi:hypothetical protein
MADRLEPGWEAATWEGSRRQQLRRALRLSPRQRLEAMVALSDTARQLASSPEVDSGAATVSGGSGEPAGSGGR